MAAGVPVPGRVQLRRTAGWRKPEGAVVVARPSTWGNPWKVGTPHPEHVGPTSRAEAVQLYRTWIEGRLHGPDATARVVEEGLARLRGHDLACWCPLTDAEGRPVPCHVDVLLELANRGPS